MIAGAVIVAAMAAVSGGERAAPVVTGADASVAVNRGTGEIAVLRGRTLTVVRDGEPLEPVDLTYAGGRVLDFRGATILMEFPEADEQAAIRAAMSPRGRERLAWPNPGVGSHFPHMETGLTVDGRGLHGDLILDHRVRGELGGLEGIPEGAGVVATFRFRGGLVQARASESFGPAVALTTDDFLVSLRDGGLLRFRSPDGVVWSLDPPLSGSWRVVDVDPEQGVALTERGGEWVAAELDSGRNLWTLGAEVQAQAMRTFSAATGLEVEGVEAVIRDGRLLPDGRVLVHGGATFDWVSVLNPLRGEMAPAELLSGLSGPEWAPLREFWRERRLRLDSVQVWPSPEGVVLLVRGPDGWYRVPLPGSMK